jgi:hypothetical protein
MLQQDHPLELDEILFTDSVDLGIEAAWAAATTAQPPLRR